MATAGTIPNAINRFGLSQVYNSPGDGLVDIVFIHGLNGHPYDTWTSEKSKIFWPGQLLPLAINEEKARVLVYGYNTDVASFVKKVSKDNIHNHAEQLVAELYANRRRQKAIERPLIFIAHSLGGLIVKRALIYSSEIRSNKTEHLRSIFISTYGILFLGIPHGASDVAEWHFRLEDICGALLPTGSVNSQPQLVNTSITNSETIQNIDRSFIQLANRFHIYFFYEGKPTYLNGTLRYIVNEESASPNIQDVERACIQQDHSHISKFENDSAPGFHIVTEAISRYTSQALETIVLRWNVDKAEQRKRKEAQAEELLPTRLAGTQGSHYLDAANEVGPRSQAAHPVIKNYRKVHVTIIHWESDRLGVLVETISNVLRNLYQYEVREIALAIEDLHERGLEWPWPEFSSVGEKDLQIIYYLGDTTKDSVLAGKLIIRACPFQQIPDQSFHDHHVNWLAALIGIPQLTSDVLLVLDCYLEGVSETTAEEKKITHLLDDDYAWARYAIIFAGYNNRSSPPGGLSERLIRVLRDLAQSDTFYAREGHINSRFVFNKIQTMLRGEDQMEPALFGNDVRGSIVLAPLRRI